MATIFRASLANAATTRRSRVDQFTAPNLLVTTLVVVATAFTPVDMGTATTRARGRVQEQQFSQLPSRIPTGTPSKLLDWTTTLRKRPLDVESVPLNLPLAAAANPFRPVDLELARGRRPLLQESLTLNYPTRIPTGTPVKPDAQNEQQPATRRRQPQLVDSTPRNLPLSLVAQAPFTTRIDETSTRSKRSIVVNYALNISLGLDQFFTDSGNGPFNYDWTVQRRARRLLLDDSVPLNVPLRLSGAFPFIQKLDERQQKRARPSQDGNTWLHALNPNLIGKDARGPFVYDWTVIRGRRPNPTYQNSLNLSLGEDTFFTGAGRGAFNYDWTIPRKFRPNPEEPVFRNYLAAIPPVPPFTQERWAQEPPSRRRPVHDRPSLDINRLPILYAIKPIGQAYFESSPRPRQSVERHTFLHEVNLLLIGKDAFFNGPGRGPFNYDWSITFRRGQTERYALNDLARTPVVILDLAVLGDLIETSTRIRAFPYSTLIDDLHRKTRKT